MPQDRFQCENKGTVRTKIFPPPQSAYFHQYRKSLWKHQQVTNRYRTTESTS